MLCWQLSEERTFVNQFKGKKKMKKWILAGSAFAFAACLWAQEPQEIRGIIEESRDSVWYAGQVKAWDRVVMQDTLDEKAWRNLFEAAKGLSMVAPREGGKAMQAVLARMKQAIPGTFTYNISAYRVQQGPGNAFAEKALKQLPADIRDRGYDAILGYLWMMGDADGEGGGFHAGDFSSCVGCPWALRGGAGIQPLDVHAGL